MSSNSDETIPQIALFIQELKNKLPPPPPQTTSNLVPRTSVRALRPMVVPMHHLRPPPPPAVPSTSTSQLHNLPTPPPPAVPSTSTSQLLNLPTPPPPAVPSTSTSQLLNLPTLPPPAVPSTSTLQLHNLPAPPPPVAPSMSTSQLHNTFYRAQSPQPSTSYAICHPPTVIHRFDATRPPPSIHNNVQPNNNILKRPMSDCCTAGPSKLRRTEEPKPDEAMCDACVQREISIESYRIQMEKLSAEDECQTLLLKKKQNEYLRQKDILRSLVDSDLFRKIEEFVEDVPQYNFQSVLNNFNDSFRTGTSSIPNQMLLQFMDYFLSDSSKFESSQSARALDSLRQTLSAMSRSSVRRTSPDFLKTLQNILNNEDRPSSSERTRYGETSVERAHSSGANGVSSFRRYSNGQHVEPRLIPRMELRAPPPPPPPVSFPPPTPQPPPAPVPTQPAAIAPRAPPPAVTYPHYPPPRAYYPPRYPPEPTPSTSRAPIQPYPPYGADRYPSPYYYYQ